MNSRERRRGAGVAAGRHRRFLWQKGAIAVLLALVVGCGSPERLPSVPSADTAEAQPLGLANARFFVGDQSGETMAEFGLAVRRQRQALGLAADAQLPASNLLAISGGGDNGAFGAGLLVGWTDAGDRPEFQLVTGVSTGALIAPFAFLGPAYDRQLRDVYTTISAKDVFVERGLLGAIFDDALSDTTPLWDLISKYVDQSLMEAIAREYRKGRLLLIGTTDLDAQRPSIWNVGAIAASGHADALDLIRKILRASSAVPGVFQPVLIDVELDGKAYQELHVDGGAIAQMFLYPPTIDLRQVAHRERKAYLIRNARLDAEWAEVERRTLSIAGRAISTMIHYSGSNDVLRIYFVTRRDGVDYNLAYIGDDFAAPRAGDFDEVYMNALFDYAYERARRGYSWRTSPLLGGAEDE
jgi:predicted patatin/cPLA2 family phospholipase